MKTVTKITSEFTKEQLIKFANAILQTETAMASWDCMAGQQAKAGAAIAEIALASLESPAVMYSSQETLDAAEQGEHLLRTLSKPSGDAVIPLYTVPPAPVSVPDEQHSERFNWTYAQWAEHLGGRHQNNDPANYYEFGSFMAVAEMLRQFGNVQRKVGWNACRAAMLPSQNRFVPVAEYIGGVSAIFENLDSRMNKGDKLYALLPSQGKDGEE